MSKKKDRADTNYRNCPVCGSKRIIVWQKGRIKRKTHICCGICNKDIEVKEILRTRNLDSIIIEHYIKRKRCKR